MNNIIELKNVTFEYKSGDGGRVVKALDRVDLAIEEGSFTGIIGVNGSGKSTLAKNMNGLMLPTEGEVLVNGEVCTVRGRKLHPGDRVELGGEVLLVAEA